VTVQLTADPLPEDEADFFVRFKQCPDRSDPPQVDNLRFDLSLNTLMTMKGKPLLLSTLLVLSLASDLRAQGTVTFGNNSSTYITNSLTGMRVVVGTTFRVALYAAADGTTDESQFVTLGAPTSISLAPGIYVGGTRTAPMVPVGVPGGAFGMFQVKAWEFAYGTSYEEAAAAPPMNGRSALVGKSNLVRVRTGDPNNGIVAGFLTDSGLQAFILGFSPGSSLSINDLVVSEGTNGTRDAVFTVTLYLPREETVWVDFATTDGTALAGSDYMATNGTLVFNPGESNKTVTVQITADLPPEDDEDFFLRLSNAVNAPIARAQGRCVITEVRIDSISIDVVVRFNTVAQRHYVLEKSDDLTTWSAVAGAEDILGTGGLVTAVDHNGGSSPNRIYRGRLLP
jgi:hypothetical protein